MMTPLAARLAEVATQAGVLARGHFQRVAAERKADRTLVTAADRETEALLVSALERDLPSAGILGEEGTVRPSRDGTVLAIDPVDGTAAFVAGLPTWCVCVGLLRDGAPAAGVIHVPMTGETYVADAGRAWYGGQELPALSVRPPGGGDRFVVTHARAHGRHRIAYDGKIRSLGSTAYHLALVARGAAEAAVLGRVQIWDLAAPAAILQAVGGDIWTIGGGALSWRALLDGAPAPDYLIAADRLHLPQWITRIRGVAS